jgi:hypothetical protein
VEGGRLDRLEKFLKFFRARVFYSWRLSWRLNRSWDSIAMVDIVRRRTDKADGKDGDYQESEEEMLESLHLDCLLSL